MNLIPATTAPWGDVSAWLMPEDGGAARIARTARVYDHARVSGNAEVYGDARVSDNARISDNADVSGNADIRQTDDYLTVGPVGTARETLTLHRDLKLGIRINRGCFSGSLDEFMAKLTECPEHQLYRQIVPGLYAGLRNRMTPLSQEERCLNVAE